MKTERLFNLTEKVLILSDTHFPLLDKKLWKATLNLIEDLQPDEIVHIGDLMDYPQPSRWTRGTREEFEGSVYEDSKACIKEYIEPLRSVYQGPIKVHEGNHDARTRLYMEKYAPALAETDIFNFDKLLSFEDYGIELLPEFYDIAPGWITTHGHLGGIRLNQNAGITALNAAKRMGKSVVMGHTHRAGITHYTTGYNGLVDTLTGVEVGHVMNPKSVTYLKGATGNWQQSLGMLTLDGKHVTPSLIPVSGGKLTLDGKTYKI